MLLEPRNKIALDTNMLLAISQFKVDILKKLKEKNPLMQIIVPRQVINELKILSGQNKSIEKHCIIAIESINMNKIKVQEIKAENADQALIKLSQKNILIATNDKALRKKIHEKNGKTVCLRKKKFLAFEE